jgi:hypothetical protein
MSPLWPRAVLTNVKAPLNHCQIMLNHCQLVLNHCQLMLNNWQLMCEGSVKAPQTNSKKKEEEGATTDLFLRLLTDLRTGVCGVSCLQIARFQVERNPSAFFLEAVTNFTGSRILHSFEPVLASPFAIAIQNSVVLSSVAVVVLSQSNSISKPSLPLWFSFRKKKIRKEKAEKSISLKYVEVESNSNDNR